MLRRLRTFLGTQLPWWLTLGLGAGCVVLGGLLIADPFRSLTVLAWVAAAALVVSGVAELASARASSSPWLSVVAGVVCTIAGVAAVAWPGLTIRALSVVVGIALVAVGALKVFVALTRRDDERLFHGLVGTTNVVVGTLVLSWPDLTVLALAVLFGIGVVVFGFGQIATAVELRRGAVEPWNDRRRWPRWLRLGGALVGLVLALGAMAISIAIERAAPGDPGPFYTAPDPLPAGPPGTLIRSEVVDGYRPGATTYRVLYTSTGYDGKPTAVSGLVLVPDGEAPAGGRPVVAYTHGTIGVTSRCGPSLMAADRHPLFLEGGDALLDAGYVVAASDYQGLGTPDPHPYLVGESAAMDTLDSVRAARNLAEARAGTRVAVWGHSQGGHAALFTGQLASSYAPELELVGVAAGGPVPNLVALFKTNVGTRVGKILIAMALQSWARVYDAADLAQIVTPAARPSIGRIARNCLYEQRQILASVPSALVLGLTFLHTPVWEAEPWKTIARENTPGQRVIPFPLLVVQGGADSIVDRDVTRRFVDGLCARGDNVALRVYPGAGHLATSQAAAPDVVEWIGDRFAGRPFSKTCT